MRLKVVHILGELRFSGAEVMLKSAYRHFLDHNIDSHILSTGDKVGDYARLLEDEGYTIVHIPFKKSLGFFVSLFMYLRRTKSNVVHIHNERASFWYAAVAKCSGVLKVVRTVHSSFDFKSFLQVRRFLQRFLMRKFLNVRFVAVSDGVKANEMKVFRNPCTVVNNWIDQSRFFPEVSSRERATARARFSIPRKAFVLISVGSCEEVKNHRAIVDALSNVIGTLDNVAYLHVGEGRLMENEKNYALSCGLAEKVRFVGQLQDVRQALIASDVFVISSLYEGLPVSVLEAFATGIPVVAYDVKSINSVIQDGRNGVLCGSDSRHLADAVLRLHQNKKLKDQISRNGLNTIQEEYSIDKSLEKLIKLYVDKQTEDSF